nr:hypothetical protein [Sulfolobus islandicus]
MKNIANSYIASFLVFAIVTFSIFFFSEDIGLVTSISVHAPPQLNVTVHYEANIPGVDCLPRYTPAYMQIWITNNMNTTVRIYNLTILPKGYAEIVRVCDYAPNVNANNIPAQELNATLEPYQTVVLLVAYKLNYPIYFGPLTVILH